MINPNSQPLKEFRNLLYYTAKVLTLFLKLFFLFIFSPVLSICLVCKCFLYLRIVDIMLIISVIAVRLHAQLNIDFYGRLCLAAHRHGKWGGSCPPEIFLPPYLDHFCPSSPRHFDLITNI